MGGGIDEGDGVRADFAAEGVDELADGFGLGRLEVAVLQEGGRQEVGDV